MFHPRPKALLIGLILMAVSGFWEFMTPSASAQSEGAAQAIGIDDAVRRALQTSPGIKKAERELDAVKSVRQQRLAKFAPTLALTGKVGTAKDLQPIPGDTTPLGPRDHNEYQAGLELRQSLFRGFRDYYALQESGSGLVEGDLELRKSHVETRLAVIEAYFGIQLSLTKLAAEEEIAVARQKQLEVVTHKFQAGTVTDFDTLEAQYEVATQKPVIAAQKSELEKRKLKFAHLVGMPLDQKFTLKTSLETGFSALEGVKLPSISQTLAIALQQNLELEKIRASRRRLEFQAGEHRGAHLPTVDFVLNAGNHAYRRADVGTPEAASISGMIEVSIPLFSGFESVSQRAEDSHRIAANDEAFEQIKNQMFEDLIAVFSDLDVAKARAETERANVELTGQAIQRTRVLYGAGKITLKDVLDTYTKQLAARENLAQAMFDRIMALAKIQKITGGVSVSNP